MATTKLEKIASIDEKKKQLEARKIYNIKGVNENHPKYHGNGSFVAD